MASGFLETVDALLSMGIDSLSDGFLRSQTKFVESKQLPDGGFPSRLGGSDLYYTDFAARILNLIAPESLALAGIGKYVSTLHIPPRDVVECFSLLNIVRILRERNVDVTADAAFLVSVIERQGLPDGGFARVGSRETSAYNSFLAALCFDMLDMDFPAIDAANGIKALRRDDGGYSELASESCSQTNATAAVVAFLRMQEAISDEDIDSASDYLASMQSVDGGLRAQPNMAEGDLLSTFTGLLTLAMLDDPGRVRISEMARFLKKLALPDGGFGACLSDQEPDIEYAYYGLGTLALLRAYAQAQS